MRCYGLFLAGGVSIIKEEGKYTNTREKLEVEIGTCLGGIHKIIL